MINYNWEGVIYDHNFIIHKKLHEYKIPHNRLYSFMKNLILINGTKIFVKDIY